MRTINTVIFDAGGVIHASNTAFVDDIQRELGVDDTGLKQI